MQPHSSLSNFSVVIWNKNQGSKEWGRVWCFTIVPCDGFWLCLALTLWLCQPYSACACRKSTLHFTAEAEWKLVLVINYPIIIIGGEPTTSQIPQLPVQGAALGQWGQPEVWLPGGSGWFPALRVEVWPGGGHFWGTLSWVKGWGEPPPVGGCCSFGLPSLVTALLVTLMHSWCISDQDPWIIFTVSFAVFHCKRKRS